MNFNDWEQFLKDLLPGVQNLWLREVSHDCPRPSDEWHILPIQPRGEDFDVYIECTSGAHVHLQAVGHGDFKITCNTWKFEQGKLVMAALPPNFIAPRSNQWPPMVPPNQVQTAPPSNPVLPRLKAMNTPLPDAYDILKFLEAELPVATGMLSATNFFVTGFNIPDGQDYRDIIRHDLPNIRTILGDKVGFIHPDSKLLTDTDGEYATGKFAVTLTYHLHRQEAVAMMLALVKA